MNTYIKQLEKILCWLSPKCASCVESMNRASIKAILIIHKLKIRVYCVQSSIFACVNIHWASQYQCMRTCLNQLRLSKKWAPPAGRARRAPKYYFVFNCDVIFGFCPSDASTNMYLKFVHLRLKYTNYYYHHSSSSCICVRVIKTAATGKLQ